MEQEFETAESIQKWLIENRNVPPSVAAAVAVSLFNAGYVNPSSLLNMGRPQLGSLNILSPHQNVLFNELRQVRLWTHSCADIYFFFADSTKETLPLS